MILNKVRHIIQNSGLCIDSPRLLQWLQHTPLKAIAFKVFRLKFSPAVLTNVLRHDVGLKQKSALFSEGMSSLKVGGTFKTTSSGRTSLADREIERRLGEFKAPRLLEIGVSDGSSATNLIGKNVFSHVILSDRFNCFHARRSVFGTLFLDSDKHLLGVKFLCFYISFPSDRAMDHAGFDRIETINPILPETYNIPSIRRFDLFCDELDEKVQVIKCANILNKAYFSPQQIRQALENLKKSLTEGGLLMVSHNNEKYSEGEALFLLRKENGTLRLIHELNGHESAGLFRDNNRNPSALQRRILFISRSLAVGGAERQLVLLANGLAATGHRVAVATFYGGGRLEKDLSGVKLLQLNKAGRWDIIRFGCTLLREARGFDPDITYGMLGTANLCAIALKLLLPNIVTIWGIRSAEIDFSGAGMAVRMHLLVEKIFSPFADLMICNSAAGLAHSLKQGLSPKRSLVIPNGIDTSRFAPDKGLRHEWRRQHGLDDTDIAIGLVARIDPLKGHELFLKSAALLARNNRLRFFCIGGGDTGLIETLKKKAAELGLNSRLAWTGTEDDMPAAYNGLDLLCLTSITEGFPNVLAEGMACGLPCVTTDVGDAKAIVGPMQEWISEGRPEAFAVTTERVLAQLRDDRDAVASAARKHIAGNFSQGRMVAATDEAMKVLLGE